MPKSDLKSALAQIEPRTKAGKVRELMPVIEQRMAAGVRVSEILETLKSGGIVMTEGTLRVYLYRYRKQQKKTGDTVKQGQPTKRGSLGAEETRQETVRYDTETTPDTEKGPVSMQELDKLMRPDPARQATDLANYENIAKQQRRSRKP